MSFVLGVTSSTVGSETERVSKSKAAAPKVQPVREKINTSTPVEPAELANLIRKSQRSGKVIQIVDENYVRGFPGSSQRVTAYPVHRFSPAKIFKVISTTKVMSRPSYRAVAVSELKAGDKIEVVEDLGPWLKLKSRKGGYGYILAQDAVAE